MSVLASAFFVVLLAGCITLYIWSGVWAYRDAESRGKSGWIVCLMVLLLSWPIGLLVWLALRPPYSPQSARRAFDLQDFRAQ